MNKFLSAILLTDDFIFNGTIKELNEKIRFDNNKKFRTEWTDYNKFKFISKWSLGTLIIRGFPNAVEGIKGFAELKEIGENKTQVALTTKVRVEFYFFLAMFLFFYILGFLSDTEMPEWLPLLIPIGFVWFWFVYRVQEKLLFSKLKKYLMDDPKTL